MPKSKARKQTKRTSKASFRCNASSVKVSGGSQQESPTLKKVVRRVSEKPLIVSMPANESLPHIWAASTRDVEIALGSDDSFINSLTADACEVLAASSQGGGLRIAYTELLREGVLDPDDNDEVSRFWLDGCYLGTWDDPSMAIGPFLRNVEKGEEMDSDERLAAYLRLAQMFPLIERKLTNGRVTVSLTRPVTELDRIFGSQYSLFGKLPVTYSF